MMLTAPSGLQVSIIRRTDKTQKSTTYSGFKAVHTGFTTQKEVFSSSVRPLVSEVLNGFSATAFAYGQVKQKLSLVSRPLMNIVVPHFR